MKKRPEQLPQDSASTLLRQFRASQELLMDDEGRHGEPRDELRERWTRTASGLTKQASRLLDLAV